MARIGDTIELSLIKQMELLAAHKRGVVSLAQGIPSFDTPDVIKRRVCEAVIQGKVAAYSLTPGLPELREYIEEKLETDGMFYDWETEILVTAGSIEGITATLMTLLEPGDEVMIVSPSYTSYVQAIKVARGVPIFVPLREDVDWRFSLDELRQRISPRTRAILLCNPNNPTGTIISRHDLLALAEIAEQYNLTIISDEVYKDFIYDEQARLSFFTLASIRALRQRVVRVFSFSKSYAMTGWRVAYLHTDRSLAQSILKVHDSLVTCAPVISQYAALAALEMPGEEFKPYRDEYEARRDLVCVCLDRLQQFVSYVRPVATYFIFPRLKIDAINGYNGSLALARDLIEQAGVAIVPGIAFGPEGEDHLRLSFGRSRSDINEGLKRLSAYFQSL